jgi:hypothetical protein
MIYVVARERCVINMKVTEHACGGGGRKSTSERVIVISFCILAGADSIIQMDYGTRVLREFRVAAMTLKVVVFVRNVFLEFENNSNKSFENNPLQNECTQISPTLEIIIICSQQQ